MRQAKRTRAREGCFLTCCGAGMWAGKETGGVRARLGRVCGLKTVRCCGRGNGGNKGQWAPKLRISQQQQRPHQQQAARSQQQAVLAAP